MRPVVIVLSIVGVLVTSFTGPMVASPKVQKVTVIMTEYQFVPKTITVQTGTPVELALVNKGNLGHEFSVYPAPQSAPKDWDDYVIPKTYFKDMGEVGVTFPGQGAAAGTRVFEIDVEKGKSGILKFTPTRKGVFEMGCHVAGHYEAGMKGTFIVK